MGRRRVEVEVIFLDVLPVVGLAVGEAEQAFLEDRVLAVPQGERKAQLLLVVGEARQPVLTPVIGAGARLVMAEVVPGIAIVAVVFARRSISAPARSTVLVCACIWFLLLSLQAHCMHARMCLYARGWSLLGLGSLSILSDDRGTHVLRLLR
jgi:hypothetical protein